MNFLAHLYLAGDDNELIIGNFIADFVKGKAIESYSEGIQQGIRMHRLIDMFTDAHPLIETGKVALRPQFRKFSGVVMDVFGDHFLANDWSKYSTVPLHDFTTRMYQLLAENESLLPERSLMTLKYMSKQNWLFNYQHLEGIRRALTGLSNRSTFESSMETAHLELSRNYYFYQNIFDEYLPELIKFVDRDKKTEFKKVGLN
jgi:acyl carrier protein phosphodiesterase